MIIEDPHRMLGHHGAGRKDAGEKKDNRSAEAGSFVKKEECCIHMSSVFLQAIRFQPAFRVIFSGSRSGPQVARLAPLDQGIRRCVVAAIFQPSNLSCGTAPFSSAAGQLTFTVMDAPAGMEK
jgi:hypothetical protein